MRPVHQSQGAESSTRLNSQMTITSDRTLFRHGVLEHSGIQDISPYLEYTSRPLTTDRHRLPPSGYQECVVAEVGKMHIALVIARDRTEELSNESDKCILADLPLKKNTFPSPRVRTSWLDKMIKARVTNL